MRASTFALVAALALAGSISQGLAQDKSPPVAGKGGDETLSPSTLPKARQNAKETGSGQVDELSADERRRLERLRAKAAAAKAPSEPAKAAKVPSEPAKAAKAPTEPTTPAKAPSEKAEVARPQPEKPRQDGAAAPVQPAAAQVSPAPAAPRQAAPKQAAPKQAAQAPAAAPAAPRKAETAAPERPARQVSRRAHRPGRESADLDQRRAARRAYRSRRNWPEVADRAPRLGDVVPSDAPLYPMPPAYGGRAYPPFPSDDDDLPPRRRFLPW